MSLASSGLPNSSASPSVGGSRPVSIFMVVVLPQPFEPRKPNISPRSIVKLTWSTAVNRRNGGSGRAPMMIGSRVENSARRDLECVVTLRAALPAAAR